MNRINVKVIGTSILLLYLILAIYIIIENGIFIHGDAGFRLFRFLFEGHFYSNAAPGLADNVFRDFARIAEHIPIYLLLQVGVDNLSILKKVYAVTLLSYYPISWLLCYIILPKSRKEYVLLPMFSFVVFAILNIQYEASSEVHFMHALLWPLFFLITTKKMEEFKIHDMFLSMMLLILLSQSYETVFIYMALFSILLCFKNEVIEFKEKKISFKMKKINFRSIVLVGLMLFIAIINLKVILFYSGERYQTLAGRFHLKIVYFIPIIVSYIVLQYIKNKELIIRYRTNVIISLMLIVFLLHLVFESGNPVIYRNMRFFTAWLLCPSFLLAYFMYEGFLEPKISHKDSKTLYSIFTVFVLLQFFTAFYSIHGFIKKDHALDAEFSKYHGIYFMDQDHIGASDVLLKTRKGGLVPQVMRREKQEVDILTFESKQEARLFFNEYNKVKDRCYFDFSQLESLYFNKIVNSINDDNDNAANYFVH